MKNESTRRNTPKWTGDLCAHIRQDNPKPNGNHSASKTKRQMLGPHRRFDHFINLHLHALHRRLLTSSTSYRHVGIKTNRQFVSLTAIVQVRNTGSRMTASLLMKLKCYGNVRVRASERVRIWCGLCKGRRYNVLRIVSTGLSVKQTSRCSKSANGHESEGATRVTTTV